MSMPATAWEMQAESTGLTYFDRQFNITAQKVLPGECSVTRENIMLVTVLGSCVAACIRDPLAGVGGMNHFMLPESELGGSNSARYGSYAMEILINQLLKNGARRERMQAKVFGGGNVLRGFTVNQVGTRNADFVRGYLAAEGIAIAAEDLGDVHPRKIFYFPRDGRVMVKKLNAVQSTVDLSSERAYQQRLAAERIGGDVELFE
ncbi:MAG TPA: chemoreceptor glutamine deamidase CheD [Nevskiaceae bacterium]|nr:chemoreceptor glutamine deamidase CheD [Nevskiaceae bacterium]